MKWYEGMARMFCFDLVIHQLKQPYIFSCKERAPSVLTHAILVHSNLVLAMQFSIAWIDGTSPCQLLFRDSTLSISLVSWKLASIPCVNTNTVQCLVCQCLHPMQANTTKNCLLVSFSWLMSLSHDFFNTSNHSSQKGNIYPFCFSVLDTWYQLRQTCIPR